MQNDELIPEEDTQSKKKLALVISENAFWDGIEFDPDFPSIEEIRKIAWPTKSSIT